LHGLLYGTINRALNPGPDIDLDERILAQRGLWRYFNNNPPKLDVRKLELSRPVEADYLVLGNERRNKQDVIDLLMSEWRFFAACAEPATIAACSILGNRKQLATG
jgi:hypothetical protein